MYPENLKHTAGCREWSSRIEALLDLPSDDASRQTWEEHADSCADCQTAREEDRILRAGFRHSLNPGAARVSAVVMDRIRASSRTTPLFRRKELGWSLAGMAAGAFLGIWIAGALPQSSESASSVDSYAGILSDLNEETLPYWMEFYVDTEGAQESSGDSVQ